MANIEHIIPGTGQPGDLGDTGQEAANKINAAIDVINNIESLTGWTAELAIVADGDRRVMQVVDWFGGTGDKPDTGQYVGSGGFVTDIAQAVDIRGEEGSGGGIEGTQYIYVAANGTPTENAAELQAAYNTAKTMSPSASNRITVICGNGNYDFGSAFEMDTEYIDLVSLDGNRSIVFNGTGTISITANDVFVKGVNVGSKNFTIGDDLNLLKVENCQGGERSFGGAELFGNNPKNVSGTFTDCQGGEFSFGGDVGNASGIFTNCQGGDSSFGGNIGIASGIFINCQGGDFAFGGFETASGEFINCQGGEFSFSGVASGIFTNCQGGDFSFGIFEVASGTFTNCQGGEYSFGGFETASGTFTNCQGADGSFGGDGGTLEGKLFYCRLTQGTFPTVTGGGKIVLCIDGNDDVINQTA